ncbi:MAG: quaternary ammonium compound efflux SMR transporter SugE [Oscillospiraceae bacterium]
MEWLILVLAGLCEIIWAVGLKYTEGFTRLMPSIVTLVGTAASFILLAIALKKLPLGTAYAVWTGIGTVGTTLFGIFVFKEPAELLRILCILLIVTGIVGLKILSPEA